MALGTLGIFFPVLYIFFPMLFLTEALEQGMFKILLAFIGVCLLIGVISPVLGFGIFTLFGPLILMLHYCITTKRGVLETLSASTAVLFTAFLVLMHTTGILELMKDPNLPAQILETQKEVLKNLGVAKETLSTFDRGFPLMFQRMLEILPSILVILSLVISYVTFSFTGRNLLRKGKLIGQPPSFIFFSLPSGLLPISVGLIVMGFIGGEALEGTWEIMMTNVTVLFGFLFFIQGLSVLSFFASKFKVLSILKWIALFFIILTPGIQVPIVMMGLMEYVFNFRRIQRL